jgi:hypothetical protein
MANKHIQYLTVTDVVQTGPHSIRVGFGGVDLDVGSNQKSTFSAVPYLNKDNPYNALRKEVYGFARKYPGEQTYTVNNVTTVPDFSKCVELTFDEEIVQGTYTFTVDTTSLPPIKNYADIELRSETDTSSYSYTFPEDVLCRDMFVQPKPSTIEDLLRKYMSPVLDGPNFRSLIAALVSGEKYNSDTFQAAYKQLFVNTASSPYLERLAAGYGIYQTEGAEMDDDHFRKYTQAFYNKKLTEDALYSMIEVFYGITSTRAYSISESETLDTVTSGENKFVFLFDGYTTVTITINSSEFTFNTNENAAMLIDRKLKEQQVNAHCDLDGNGKIRLFSDTKGLRSSVEVVQCPAWISFTVGKKFTLYSNPNPAYIGRDASGTMQIYLPVISNISMGRGNGDGAYSDSDVYQTESQQYFPTAYQTTLKTQLDARSAPYDAFEVDDPGILPTSGNLYIGYGYSYEAGPFEYTRRNGVFGSFKIDKTIPAGAEVNFALSQNADIPTSQVDPATAALKLRDTLIDMIDAGSKYNINIYYPVATGIVNKPYVYS